MNSAKEWQEVENDMIEIMVKRKLITTIMRFGTCYTIKRKLDPLIWDGESIIFPLSLVTKLTHTFTKINTELGFKLKNLRFHFMNDPNK